MSFCWGHDVWCELFSINPLRDAMGAPPLGSICVWHECW